MACITNFVSYVCHLHMAWFGWFISEFVNCSKQIRGLAQVIVCFSRTFEQCISGFLISFVHRTLDIYVCAIWLLFSAGQSSPRAIICHRHNRKSSVSRLLFYCNGPLFVIANPLLQCCGCVVSIDLILSPHSRPWNGHRLCINNIWVWICNTIFLPPLFKKRWRWLSVRWLLSVFFGSSRHGVCWSHWCLSMWICQCMSGLCSVDVLG